MCYDKPMKSGVPYLTLEWRTIPESWTKVGSSSIHFQFFKFFIHLFHLRIRKYFWIRRDLFRMTLCFALMASSWLICIWALMLNAAVVPNTIIVAPIITYKALLLILTVFFSFSSKAFSLPIKLSINSSSPTFPWGMVRPSWFDMFIILCIGVLCSRCFTIHTVIPGGDLARVLVSVSWT